MKAVVNKKMCNGCTICNITCPEVFAIDEDGKAVIGAAVIAEKYEDNCLEAADECPANAISIIYDNPGSVLKGQMHAQLAELISRSEMKKNENIPIKKMKVLA